MAADELLIQTFCIITAKKQAFLERDSSELPQMPALGGGGMNCYSLPPAKGGCACLLQGWVSNLSCQGC